MAHKRTNPPGMRPPGGSYTHSIEIAPGARWLYVAGQTGVDVDGNVPEGIEAQSDIAFSNMVKVLEASGFGLGDVVFMKSFLTRREDRDGYQKMRSKYWGDIKPASTFLIVQGLARPEFLVEVEAVAAKE